MCDDKVSGWGWLKADVSKKYTRKKTLFACAEKKVGIFLKKLFLCSNFFMSILFLCNSQGDSLKTNLAIDPRDYELGMYNRNKPCLISAIFIIYK